MKNCGTHYEYICVYVDDLAIAMRNPQEFIDVLVNDCGNKLKGVGPMEYHLGADIYRNNDGTLCFGAKSYISRLLRTYESIFGEQPKEYSSPPLIAMTILNWIPPMSCLSWISRVFSR
jgi:hypothetical protein